ncbi:MAG: D-aminoacylase, partial [Acetobacteraceae bacterium]
MATLFRCDLVIRNATLFDGTGAPRRMADIGVTGDRIVSVGDLSATAGLTEIDAGGKAVAPGFI